MRIKSHASVWTGALATALVLYDGISNTAALEEWAAERLCGLWHSRVVGRYGNGSPLAHSCANKNCYCSDPEQKQEWIRDTLVIGEVGLAGEVRAVGNVDIRISEAMKMGFTRIVGPAGSLKRLRNPGKVALEGVGKVSEAVELLF